MRKIRRKPEMGSERESTKVRLIRIEGPKRRFKRRESGMRNYSDREWRGTWAYIDPEAIQLVLSNDPRKFTEAMQKMGRLKISCLSRSKKSSSSL